MRGKLWGIGLVLLVLSSCSQGGDDAERGSASKNEIVDSLSGGGGVDTNNSNTLIGTEEKSVSNCVLIGKVELDVPIKDIEFGLLDNGGVPVTYPNKVNEKGEFKMEFEPQKDQLYRIGFAGVPLIIYPDADTIIISGKQQGASIVWEVNGSPETAIFAGILNMSARQGNNAFNGQKEELEQYLIDNSPSIAVKKIVELELMRDVESNLALMKKINKKFIGVSGYEDFVQEIFNLKVVRIEIGEEAPDFTLPNTEGEMVSLSSFRGDYVLVDFWASWCGPCRRENPNVVKNYKAYHGKGLQVLGVSLDRSKEGWLKAIKQDGLGWNHVSDLKMWQSKVVSQYKIKGIPFMLLIDPQGKIVGKNLRGYQLDQKLAEIYGS